jgi:hypothetical protein
MTMLTNILMWSKTPFLPRQSQCAGSGADRGGCACRLASGLCQKHMSIVAENDNGVPLQTVGFAWHKSQAIT